MSYNGTIPDHERNLRIHDETTRTEIVDFLESRLSEPAVLGDVVVYNFSSYELDARAVIDAANELDAGIYAIPYQVSGVWGFMVDVLPPAVSDATLLNYRKDDGEYNAYQNYRGMEMVDEEQRLEQAFGDTVIGGERE